VRQTADGILATVTAVFGLDGYDVDRYDSADDAVRRVEGQDVVRLEWIGADGMVYEPRSGAPAWGAATLHPTDERRLDELISRLRAAAAASGVQLPEGVPDDPEALWTALVEAWTAGRSGRRRGWFGRRG
jgi:hypothetical protein